MRGQNLLDDAGGLQVLVGVPDTLQGVVIGAVSVLAVMVDQVRRRG